MEQLLLHLWGDYIIQTNWMASNKTKRSFPCLIHVLCYSLPFLLIGSLNAVLVIGITHFLIDRWYLGKYVVFAKNWVTNPSLRWENCKQTGTSSDVPIWFSFWLMVVADNTMHLTINYFALKLL